MTRLCVVALNPAIDAEWQVDDVLREEKNVRSRDENVDLADSLGRVPRGSAAATGVEELMSQRNHPNRKGHDLVAAELLKWFPSPPN